MSNFVKTTQDERFREDVTDSELPVVVDFTAAWCGPCKNYAPILESVAQRLAGKVSFYKLDVDNNPEVAQQFSIRSVPTTLLFIDGEPVASQLGVMMESQLEAFISDHTDDLT